MQMREDKQHFGGDASFDDDEVNHNGIAQLNVAGLLDQDVVELAK